MPDDLTKVHTCQHLWILVGGGHAGRIQKCEHCGVVRENPAVRQAELQESAKLNRSAP